MWDGIYFYLIYSKYIYLVKEFFASSKWRLPITQSIIMLAGIYYGTMYGGSTTSILLNIPGEDVAMITCLDGYSMAKQGRAGAGDRGLGLPPCLWSPRNFSFDFHHI